MQRRNPKLISRVNPDLWNLTRLTRAHAKTFRSAGVPPAIFPSPSHTLQKRRRDAGPTTQRAFLLRWTGLNSCEVQRQNIFPECIAFRFALLEFLLDFRRAHS
jgi:hypothetical protein